MSIQNQHIVPNGDTKQHNTDSSYCHCKPTIKDNLVIHNAFDGRELLENPLAALDEVKVFLTEREIAGHRYAERICARNWQEAQEFCDKAGVILIGEGVSEISALGEKELKPQLGLDEWDDEIG